MPRQIAWAIQLMPWLLVGLVVSFSFHISGNYAWVVLIIGAAVIELGLRRYSGHMTPQEKFHFLQPWKIPNPATRRGLLGRASFDALLYLPLYAALAAFLTIETELSNVLISAVVTGALIGIVVRRYWHMRRQYQLCQSRSKGFDGHLHYVGPSNLSHCNRLTLIATAIAGLVAIHIGILLWILR